MKQSDKLHLTDGDGYAHVSEKQLTKPCYQICNVIDNKIVPITEGFGRENGMNIVRGYYSVGKKLNEFVPDPSQMKNALTRRKGNVLLVLANEFSETNFKARFSEEGKYTGPCKTDYSKEQTVGQSDAGVYNNGASARRLFFLIDLQSGLPLTNYYQYPIHCIKNELVKSYDLRTHTLTLNTNRVFNGKYTNCQRKLFQ